MGPRISFKLLREVLDHITLFHMRFLELCVLFGVYMLQSGDWVSLIAYGALVILWITLATIIPLRGFAVAAILMAALCIHMIWVYTVHVELKNNNMVHVFLHRCICLTCISALMLFIYFFKVSTINFWMFIPFTQSHCSDVTVFINLFFSTIKVDSV